MTETYNSNLLDFLAEDFLQQGASVTFRELFGVAALQVDWEEKPAQVFTASEEEALKMAFLKAVVSEEIFIPVLTSEEEKQMSSALAKAGVDSVKVYRLSLLQRYTWYSRQFMEKRTKRSASVAGSCGM